MFCLSGSGRVIKLRLL